MGYLAPMSLNYLLVTCSCPSQAVSQQMAQALVDQRLAACVSITAPVTSTYRWEGKTETIEEILLLIKTQSACYPALEKAIQALHPYELPEIIAVPLERGERQYLNWIDQNTSPPI